MPKACYDASQAREGASVALTRQAAVERAAELYQARQGEAERLEKIRLYLRDDPNERRLGGFPADAPQDVIRLARLARVNMLKYIVNTRVQGMYLDGFQTPASSENVPAWSIWQRNGMDARQIGINRAAVGYGAAYITCLPGQPVPVMRGASPRNMTAMYAEDGDPWPFEALEKRRGKRWRLYDSERVYELTGDSGAFEYREEWVHGARFDRTPVVPVVRVRETDDLDDDARGIVEPHIPLQDQINVTTFGLHVAQHYGAFRQRWIVGWLAESEKEAAKMGASRLMMFGDSKEDVEIGEFQQTDLRGYIESRQATIKHLAVVSQTSVSELAGELINLGADALEAMRRSHEAALEENRTVAGEAYEQSLGLAGEMAGEAPDASASAVWRDTSVRSLEQAATALGELAERLGVPVRELWKRIPGIPQHEIDRWRQVA